MHTLSHCPFCGNPLESAEDGTCLVCGSDRRTRSIAPLVDDVLLPRKAALDALGRPLLGFAMTKNERILLEPVFPEITSVSLYGDYGHGHVLGVDARDLGRFHGGEFSGYFACLLFDYFTEHEAALEEAFRVLAPGGVFLTAISGDRLTSTLDPPTETKKIAGRPDYFSYLPSDVTLSDIKVGREWFLETMRRVGFSAELRQVREAGASDATDWFVGLKPPEHRTEPW